MSVGSSPASRAARRIERAEGSSPAAATSCASSSRIVTSRPGSVGGCAACRARGSPRAAPLASARRPAGRTRHQVPSRPRGRRTRSAARPSSCPWACSARGPRRTGCDGGRRQRQHREGDEAEPKRARARHLLSYRTPRGARLIGRPEMRTKSEQPARAHGATALEQARGAGDDPRLGEGARARRADGAVDDALLLRRARRAARRGRAQRRRASRRAAARRGRRPPPHARPVRPCGDGARRRPRLARAPRHAPTRARASPRRCRRAPRRTRVAALLLADADLAWRVYATSLLAEALAEEYGPAECPPSTLSAGEPRDELQRAARDAARVRGMRDVAAEEPGDDLEHAGRPGSREHRSRMAVERALRRPRRGRVAVERAGRAPPRSPRGRPRGSRPPRAAPRRTPRTCRRPRAGRRAPPRRRRAATRPAPARRAEAPHRKPVAADVGQRRPGRRRARGRAGRGGRAARPLAAPAADAEVGVVALREHPAVSAGHDRELDHRGPLEVARPSASSGTFPSSATPRTIPSPRPNDRATMPFAPSAPTTTSARTASPPTRAVTPSPSTSIALDARALAELGARRGGLLGEEGVQAPALRHPDQRLVVAPRERRPVAEPQLEAVDVTLDDRRRVDRDPLQRATGEPAAARLVAREARLVGEQHARAGAREVDRRRRAGRAGTDDEDVDALHALDRTRLVRADVMRRRAAPALAPHRRSTWTLGADVAPTATRAGGARTRRCSRSRAPAAGARGCAVCTSTYRPADSPVSSRS